MRVESWAQGGRSWAQGGRLTSLSVYESNLVIEICRERAGDRTRTRSVGTQDTHRTIDHDHHTRTVRTRKEVPHFGPSALPAYYYSYVSSRACSRRGPAGSG